MNYKSVTMVIIVESDLCKAQIYDQAGQKYFREINFTDEESKVEVL